jgi:hypothetical protein
MNERQLLRIMFEIVIIFAVGLIGFMGLSLYNMNVIDQQRDLIRQMSKDPHCMNAPGGNHG